MAVIMIEVIVALSICIRPVIVRIQENTDKASTASPKCFDPLWVILRECSSVFV